MVIYQKKSLNGLYLNDVLLQEDCGVCQRFCAKANYQLKWLNLLSISGIAKIKQCKLLKVSKCSVLGCCSRPIKMKILSWQLLP